MNLLPHLLPRRSLTHSHVCYFNDQLLYVGGRHVLLGNCSFLRPAHSDAHEPLHHASMSISCIHVPPPNCDVKWKRLMAVAEWSSDLKHITVSLLDLRGVDLECSCSLDLSSITLQHVLVPWNMYTEKGASDQARNVTWDHVVGAMQQHGHITPRNNQEQLEEEKENDDNDKDKETQNQTSSQSETQSQPSQKQPPQSQSQSGPGSSSRERERDDKRRGVSSSVLSQVSSAPIHRSAATAYTLGLLQSPLTYGPDFSFVESMEFSADCRYLALACSGPHYPLFVWDWQTRTRFIGYPKWIGQHIISMKFNTSDHSKLIILTSTLLREYTIMAGDWRINDISLLVDGEKYVSLTQLNVEPYGFIISTTQRILHLDESFRILHALPLQAHALTTTQFGFAAAIGSAIHIYEFQHSHLIDVGHIDGKDTADKYTSSLFAHSQSSSPSTAFQLAHTIALTSPATLLATSQSTSHLLAVTRDKTLLTIDENLIQIGAADQERSDDTLAVDLSLRDYVKTFLCGLPLGPIHSLSVAQDMPTVLICSPINNSSSFSSSSSASILRLINYHTRQLVCEWELDGASLCCLSPSGLEMLVCFERAAHIYHIIDDELVKRGDLDIAHATAVSWSPSSSSVCVITGRIAHVFSTVTMRPICVLKGHIDTIVSHCYSPCGDRIYTAGQGGSVYQWDMNGTRIFETVNPQVSYSSISCSPRGVAVAGVQQAGLEAGWDIEHIFHPPLTKQAPRVDFVNSSMSLIEKRRSDQLPSFEALCAKASEDPTLIVSWMERKEKSAHCWDHDEVPDSTTASSPTNIADDALQTIEMNFTPYLPSTMPTSQQSAHHLERVSSVATISRSLTAYASTKHDLVVPPLLHTQLVQIGLAHFMLVGTARGTLQVWSYPPASTQSKDNMVNVDSNAQPRFLSESSLHPAPISFLQVNHRLGCVISASLDGTVLVSNLELIFKTINRADTTQNEATNDDENEQSETFPVHLFLSPSLHASLYPRITNATLQQFLSGYTDQKRLYDAWENNNRKNKLLKDEALNNKQLVSSQLGHHRRSSSIASLTNNMSLFSSSEANTSAITNIINDVRSLELCVIYRAHLHKYKREIYELRKELQSMRTEWDNKIKRDVKQNERMRLEALELEGEKQGLKEREKRDAQEADKKREMIQKKILEQQAKKHRLILTNIEKLYEKKCEVEAKKRIDDRMKYKASLDNLQLQIVRLEKSHEKRTAAAQSKFDGVIAQKNSEIAKLIEQLKVAKEETLNMLNEQSLQQEEATLAFELNASHTIKSKSTEIEELQHENRLMKVQLNNQKIKILDIKRLQITAEQTTMKTDEVNKKLNNEIKSLKSTISKNEAELHSKDQSIKTLEDEKSILLQQKAELRHQVGVLLEHEKKNNSSLIIQEFEKKVKEMDDEFLENHEMVLSHDKVLAEKKSRIANLTRDVIKFRTASEKKQELLDRLREDIFNFKDMNALKQKYSKLFRNKTLYLNTVSGVVETPDDDRGEHEKIEQEYARQSKKYTEKISYLEGVIEEYKRQISFHNRTYLNENIDLMHQINDLRYVNRDFKEELMELSGENQKATLVKHLNENVIKLLSRKVKQLETKAGKEEITREIIDKTEQVQRLSTEMEEMERELAAIKLEKSKHAEMEKNERAINSTQAELLNNTYNRMMDQEEEIKLLRAALQSDKPLQLTSDSHAHAANSSLPVTSPTQRPSPYSSTTAASYVDALLAQAETLRQRYQQDASNSHDAQPLNTHHIMKSERVGNSIEVPKRNTRPQTARPSNRMQRTEQSMKQQSSQSQSNTRPGSATTRNVNRMTSRADRVQQAIKDRNIMMAGSGTVSSSSSSSSAFAPLNLDASNTLTAWMEEGLGSPVMSPHVQLLTPTSTLTHAAPTHAAAAHRPPRPTAQRGSLTARPMSAMIRPQSSNVYQSNQQQARPISAVIQTGRTASDNDEEEVDEERVMPSDYTF